MTTGLPISSSSSPSSDRLPANSPEPQPLTSEQESFIAKIRSVLPDAQVTVVDGKMFLDTETVRLGDYHIGFGAARLEEMSRLLGMKTTPKPPKMTPRRRLQVIDAAVERSIDLSK